MLFMERNTFSCTRVLCIKRSVTYDIPPFVTIRRLAKLLVACPSAIREIGQTNRSLRSTLGDTVRSWTAVFSVGQENFRRSVSSLTLARVGLINDVPLGIVRLRPIATARRETTTSKM